MITLIVGENSFENSREIQRITAGFVGDVHRCDGETLELKQLPDLLMGSTLFADKKLVIIKNLSENKSLWNVLPEWLERLSDDVHLLLVEEKPDKRTKTYKEMQKHAVVRVSKVWTDRDGYAAEQWVADEAKQMKLSLDKESVHHLVNRVGVDQWLLYQALQKLSLAESITPEIIDDLTDANPTENVFNLLEAALKGNSAKVKQMLSVLETNEEPYRLFALLSTQVFQLAVLSVADDQPPATVASDIGAHPFALSKLAPFAKKLGRDGARNILQAFAEADTAMKTTAAEPWLLIERALLKTATVAK